MDNNDSEARLNDLVLEMSNLKSIETEATLQKEMAFRKAMEKSIPSGIAVIDDAGKQVYVNQSFCEMIGWEEDELLWKQPPFVYWSQQDHENIVHAFRRTLENKITKQGFDLIFCHKTGKLIPVQVNISPFTQEDGKIFFLANVIDITERKKAEEALKKSQLLLTSSIESQKDTIIFSIDHEYNYLYYNKAHLESMKFAYNYDIKPGMNILDCISSVGDRKLARANYDRALGGESYSQIQTFGDVNIAYYESHYNPVLNEKNEIIGCTGLARNITQRKHADQTLIESETKFREIVNQSNDGIIVFDERGKIIIWNNGAEQICGLKADAVLNLNIVDVKYRFVTPRSKDKTLIENEIKNIITLQTPGAFNQIHDEEIIPYNSKNIRNTQTRVFPIELNGYNLFCVIFRDVTEIKRYEKELEQMSADKDKFYSIIAQYLYTPFNSFHSFTKLMAEELDTMPLKEIQKMVSIMSKSATNLYSLLDNLLQWTQLKQGKFTFDPQKLDFIKISQDAVSILKPNLESKYIKINHIAADKIILFADVFMIKTILRNLVSNAIKFTNDGGEITISAEQMQSDVTISVKDNGIGENSDYMNNLFNISEINKSLSKATEKGNTLGLLLCKEFVEKHGGKIWAVSDKNTGTELKFTLPF